MLEAFRAGTASVARLPRAPVDTIAAPPFPRDLPWVNVATLRLDQQRGRPVLIEFWDFCRVHSLRTLPYLRAWHERYAEAGLRVIGVHAPGFAPGRDEEQVRDAVARLEVPYAVALDTGFRVWQAFGNKGWPARYLFDAHLRLHSYHYGQGGYDETERDVQELLGVQRDLVEPLRPEDVPGARLAKPEPGDQDGAWSGRYAAGGVWAVLDGQGEVRVNGRRVAVERPGCHPLVLHERHAKGVLDLRVGDGAQCLGVQFEPGLLRG